MTTTRSKPPSRSSLVRHSFPPFYACYLLRSIQTPHSKATYIGSTPSPPRRLRQHNGEITAGAWKTKHKRPWVMQMIVHGFPSKLAALQFEWAWQHPNMSRHLRDGNGKPLFLEKRARHLKANIQVVRTMIANHPYSNWPLHVKLFTDEAVKLWNQAQNGAVLPLPLGFTCLTELEGVDGKSGKIGSGRLGPINVKDDEFTASYLAKSTALVTGGQTVNCSICHEPLNYSADPLSTALCPQPTCVRVSHLLCLSKEFLQAQSTGMGMIPHGGNCRTCNTYILWGDVIRGCYRRFSEGTLCDPDEDRLQVDEDDHGELCSSGAEMNGPALAVTIPPKSSPTKTKTKIKGKAKAMASVRLPPKKRRLLKAVLSNEHSSEGELINLDVSSTSSDLDHKRPQQPFTQTAGTNAMNHFQPSIMPRTPIRISYQTQPSVPAVTTKPRSVSRNGRSTKPMNAVAEESEDFFDLNSISGSDSDELLTRALYLKSSRKETLLCSAMAIRNTMALSGNKVKSAQHAYVAVPCNKGEVDFFDDSSEYDEQVQDGVTGKAPDGSMLQRAMSILSVSSDGGAVDNHRDDEVIELTDS